jgi:MFS family permease
MSLLRTHSGFRRLWMAGAISLVGDWLSFVAVSVLALTHGGGAIGLAVVFAAHALPAALLAPVAGALVDRVDRRRALVGADAVAGIVTASMAAAAAAGWLTAVQVLLLVRSAVSSIVPPGESAALRRLVPTDQLVPANAILAATWSVAYVAGMALGGAAALLGPMLALLLDASSFFAAAAIHATLPPLPVDRPEGDRAARLIDVVRATPRDTLAALRVAAGHRPLLAALLGKMPLGLAAGAGWIALNLVGASARPFGAAALSFGILQALRGAGTGIGPAMATALANRGVSDTILQHAARVTMLGAVAALTFARDPITLSAVALVWGIGTGTNWVMSHAALQRNATDLVIGRLAAFDELLVTAAMVVSALIGGVIADASGEPAAAIAGVTLGCLGLAVAAAILGRADDGARDKRNVSSGVAI